METSERYTVKCNGRDLIGYRYDFATYADAANWIKRLEGSDYRTVERGFRPHSYVARHYGRPSVDSWEIVRTDGRPIRSLDQVAVGETM